MRGWTRRLPAWLMARRGGMIGPVLTLASGTVVAQAAAYAARPVLTRLFEPAAFGYLAFFMAAAGILAEASTGRYEAAAMLPDRDDEARKLLRLAAALAVAAAAAALVLIPLGEPIAAAVGRPGLAPFLALVPVAALAAAWTRTAEVWLTRRHRFAAVSTARAAQSALAAPLQILAGLVGAGPIGLVAGLVAGRVVTAAGAVAAAVRTPTVAAPAGPALPPSARNLAARYRRFPLLSMPAGVLNTVSAQLPAFVLLAAFSPEVAGFYGVAYATLALPMQLVGTSVAQVFFVRAAEALREGVLAPLVRRVTGRLALIGTFPLAALVVVGPDAFALVFGPDWREAGVHAQLLAPWLLLVFIGSPVSSLFDVLERQGAELAANVALGVGRLGALVLGGALGGSHGAVLAFSAVGAVGWAVQTAWLLRKAGARGALAEALARPMLLAVGPVLAVLAIRLLGAGDAALVGGLILAGGGYVALAVRYGGPPAARQP